MAGMFDEIRAAFHDLLHGNASPEIRRSALAEMRETLVQATLGLDDLRRGLDATRKRIDGERCELETVRRRKGLAANINDGETIRIAERFEVHLSEKIVVLERKLEIQEAELVLVEREVTEMTAELKSAQAGRPLTEPGSPDPSPSPAGADLPDDEAAQVSEEIDRLARQRRRAEAEAQADEKLAAIKRRMGK